MFHSLLLQTLGGPVLLHPLADVADKLAGKPTFTLSLTKKVRVLILQDLFQVKTIVQRDITHFLDVFPVYLTTHT